MPGLERTLSPPPVMTQPRCPVCGSPMDLARTLKDQRGYEIRAFDCTNCEHSERWLYKEAS
jgi:hypothetical protein